MGNLNQLQTTIRKKELRMGDRNEIVGISNNLDKLPIYENKKPIKRSLHNVGHKRWKEIPNLGSIFQCHLHCTGKYSP